VRRVTSEGVTLAVEVFGKGPPLLFAHGLGSCRHHVKHFLEPLAYRHQVIVFDQRGHCESTPITDPALFEARRLAGDIGHVLDHLGIERANLAGESMGAATTLLFATQHPERVERLVQIGPTVVDMPNPGREMIQALGDLAAKHGLEAAADAVAIAAMASGVPRQAAAMVTAHWTDHDVASFIAAHRAVPEWVLFDSLAPIAALPMPIGIFAWGNDPTRPLSQARRLATAARHGRFEAIDSLAELAENPALYGRMIDLLLSD
jgi:3-oxoadipate enol-lactonase